LKAIDTNKNECQMLESVVLDDSIEYLCCVPGIFRLWHSVCGGLRPVKTTCDTPFVVGYTKRGNFTVWCARCLTNFFRQELGIEHLTNMQFLNGILCISGDHSILIYRVGTSNLILLGEMQTSGNQTMTCFAITEEMRVIAGTSSGEIIGADIELDDDGTNYIFHWKFHVDTRSAPFRMCYDRDIEKVGICLCDGTVLALNPTTGTVTSERKTMDGEPLSAAWFHVQPGRLFCFIAFGTKLHSVELELTEPRPEPEVVQEVEQVREPKRKIAPSRFRKRCPRLGA
jgi:hypothetical protein